MSKFENDIASEAAGRPVLVVVTTAIMFVALVISGVMLVARGSGVPYLLAKSVPGLILGIGFLWFYWNGYAWTRYLVLALGAITLIDAFFGTGKLFSAFSIRTNPGLKDYLDAVWNFFYICLSCWLLTPAAKNYFSTEARHERKSLKSFRRLGSATLQ